MEQTEISRVALATGGSRGIGLGVARQLAVEGFDLAIIGRKPEAEIDSLVELRALGREVHYCRGDISRSGDREAMLQEIDNRFPPINLLVNNTGIAPKQRVDLLQTSEASYHQVLNTNLTGPFFLTQSIARRMVAAKAENPGFIGMIVTISSISSTLASVERAEYCISKAGLSMLTKLSA